MLFTLNKYINAMSLLLVLPLSSTLASDRPIIGILAQEVSSDNMSTSYIAASYVKAVESSGARVVPIFIGKDDSYYRELMSKVNGVVFPGGSSEFDLPSGYAAAGAKIYHIAKKLNAGGDHYPLLGVCLGFELLLYLAARSVEHRTRCSSSNKALPLAFKPHFRDSSLFRSTPRHIIHTLATYPVTSNHHKFCVTEKNITSLHLNHHWKVLTENEDDDGLTFVSTVESRQYPFVGVQFHPEKNAYEWGISQNNPHSSKAIVTARLFYDWLVNESRRNHHSFASKSDESRALIYNYSAQRHTYFEQSYYFSALTDFLSE